MIRRLAVALVAMAAALVLLAEPVAAHSQLIATEPAQNAVLDAAPDRIVLRFNEPVEATSNAIRLYDREGREQDVGDAQATAGGLEVVADVGEVEPGTNFVAWRVQSADGHPINGAFPFQVGTGVPAPRAGLIARLLSQDAADESVSAALAVARVVAYGALAVVVGGLFLLAVAWPAGVGMERVRRLLWIALCAGAVASVAAIGLQFPYATGGTIADALRVNDWSDVLETRAGRAWGVRVLLLAIAATALMATIAHLRRWWWQLAAIVTAGLLFLAVTYSGHGASGQWPALGVSANLVHLAGMSVWVGGLAVVLVGALPDRDATRALAVVRRFSPIALVAVVAIVVSGVAQAYRQIGSLDALTGTTYGRLLLVKTGVVAVLIGVAAFSRRILHRQPDAVVGAVGVRDRVVAKPVGAAVLDHLPPPPSAPATRRQLRRTVAVEVALAVVVLVVTSLLVAAPPGRADEPRPFNTTLVQGDRQASITVTPATVGRNQMHVYLITPGGTLDRATSITVRVTMPERDLGPLTVPMLEYPNHVTTDDLQLPFAGTWQLEVLADFAPSGQTRFSTSFEVR